jgi:hypothetical protein
MLQAEIGMHLAVEVEADRKSLEIAMQAPQLQPPLTICLDPTRSYWNRKSSVMVMGLRESPAKQLKMGTFRRKSQAVIANIPNFKLAPCIQPCILGL